MRTLLSLIVLLASICGSAIAAEHVEVHDSHEHAQQHLHDDAVDAEHEHDRAVDHIDDHRHLHDHTEVPPHSDCVECVLHAQHEEDTTAALNILAAAGTSDADADALPELNGGGHDPNEDGFNLQQIELALDGRINNWLSGSAHVVQGEEELELEEAYLTVAEREGSAELKAGYLLTPFGTNNQRHPHRWQWIDQPLIATRLLGSEGSRGLGLRGDAWNDSGLRLSAALQQADDETLVSFRGSGHVHGEEEHGHGEGEEEDLAEHLEELYGGLTVGNRPLVEGNGGMAASLRLSQAWRSGCATHMVAGVSFMGGPNGSGADSRTQLWGADFSLRWQPCPEEQWPFVLWESEYMQRSFDAAAVFNDDDPAEVIDLPAASLRDSGWYSQVLYGFEPGWAAGIRYESASGSGDSIGGIENDPLRDERTRISPLLAYYPDEDMRLRLQYNHDRAQFLGGGTSQTAGTLWLGVDVTLGEHAHKGDPGLSAESHGEHEGHAEHEDGGESGSHAGHGH